MSRRKQSAYDLEEITPSQFIVHNENAYGVLRGEGERHGQFFELTGWRREGLLARLAARGYRALTLEDRVAALPAMPEPLVAGEEGWRPLASPSERFSVFDPAARDWRPLEPVQREGAAGVVLHAGQIVRRRKGRGAADYYTAIAERNGGIGLRPMDETTALLAGYAQAAVHGPSELPTREHGEAVEIAHTPLPQPYREFLRRVAQETPDGWRIDQRGLPYVRLLFERLGLTLQSAGEAQ